MSKGNKGGAGWQLLQDARTGNRKEPRWRERRKQEKAVIERLSPTEEAR